MQAVVEMPTYLVHAKRAGMTEAEGNAIVDFLARNPKAGVVMPGTGGARKLRWAAAGRGKRGGYRIITYWGGAGIPVFLLDVYAKNERSNLSPAGRQVIKSLTDALLLSYRDRKRT